MTHTCISFLITSKNLVLVTFYDISQKYMIDGCQSAHQWLCNYFK